MLEGWIVLLVASAYLGVLFAIAYVGDRRADQGRSIINNPYIYTLSIAVYCTAWTYYGSVGRAAASGLGFLPIYLGPTLMACLWWFVLRKMLRITKAYGITTIADFVASRYGKSALARRPRHAGRGGRHHALHLAPAESRLDQRRGDPRLPGAGAVLAPISRCSWRCCWPPSASCSAPATSTRPSTTRAWSRRSPSNRSSSWSPSCRRHLRHLRPVRRLRRHLRAGASPPASASC